mgnify:CR=1 FL=1
MASPAPDRFRGTVQRWSIDAGPLAGSACDYTFHDDWSVSWRNWPLGTSQACNW